MPTIDSRAISARVNNQIADRFFEIARERNLTASALLCDMIYSTVNSEDMRQGDNEETSLSDSVSRLYAFALGLVDDLVEAGYPDSEIECAFTDVRRDML